MHAHCTEVRGHSSDAVGFLDAQFSRITDHSRALRQRRCHGKDGDFINHIRDFSTRDRRGAESGAFYVNVSHRLTTERGFDDFANARAHADEDIDNAGAGRIQADILHQQAGTRLRGGGDQPESGTGDVARNREIHRLWHLAAFDGRADFNETPILRGVFVFPNLFAFRFDEKVIEHPLGVVARADIFDHRGGAFGKKSREENRAFDLRAGDRRAVGDALQIAMALDHKRRAGLFAFRVEICPHEAQRIDDALHRALRKRGIAGEAGGEILRGKDAGHEPHRGAGVAAIQIGERLGETAGHAFHNERARFRALDENPKLAHRCGGAATILALEKIADHASAVGKGGEHDSSMRDAFVRRNRDFGVDECRTAG